MKQFPSLYARIDYDTDRETEAFRRLSALDVAGCRRSLERLLDGLNLAAAREDRRPLAHLLLDVLHRINHCVHGVADDRVAYQANRVALIDSLAGCDDPHTLRERFLTELEQLLRPLQPGKTTPHPLVQQAKLFIEERYHERISLSTVAEQLHISANYLSRLFRREAGITLTAYVQRIRLSNALLLLAEGRYSISEIAYRVGYQNYRDFYRNFVKYENASPRQVQRRLARGAGSG